jgi:hypothetical protein
MLVGPRATDQCAHAFRQNWLVCKMEKMLVCQTKQLDLSFVIFSSLVQTVVNVNFNSCLEIFFFCTMKIGLEKIINGKYFCIFL